MSLNFGRSQLAIPGPSVMPDRVLNAMHRASPNIYEGELVEMTASLFPDLKAVGRTKHDVAIYIGNGHAAWEASIVNTLAKGDKILVLVTGHFAMGWTNLIQSHGIEVQIEDFGMQGDADPARVEELLRSDKSHKIKAVLTVQADTASSVINNVPALRKAIDAAKHPALFFVDCIASLGCDQFEMDDWGVDVMVAACQKGLMTPAGMSFVFLNPKAMEARKRADPGSYWDWVPRTRHEYFYQQFCGTAPTHHLFGLREALTMLVHEEGVENCWARHRTISKAFWAAVQMWGKDGEMQHNIFEATKRTVAVSTIETGTGNAARIRQWTEQNAGVTLGVGLGFGLPGSDTYKKRFRIGHMGHQNIAMTMGVIGAIDCALKALNIRHGDGAMEAATKVLAAHG